MIPGAPPRPMPPPDLIALVTGGHDEAWFLEGGSRAAASIIEILAKNGRTLEAFDGILDFGCGCGRVIRHLEGRGVNRLVGTDLSPELIQWCRDNLPFGEFHVNALDPPASLADASVDFAYALSVFTHLDELRQYAWMRDLRRILRPGGLLLVTTHGRPYLSELSPELQDVFEDGGLAVRSAQAVGSNDCGAFHPEDFVRTELAPAAGFFVMDFVEEGATGNPHQDVFLLQRADDEAARYLELMARITSRLHRQISRLATERKSATALTELRGYVERIHSSRGWRLLQALRGLGGRRW